MGIIKNRRYKEALQATITLQTTTYTKKMLFKHGIENALTTDTTTDTTTYITINEQYI